MQSPSPLPNVAEGSIRPPPTPLGEVTNSFGRGDQLREEVTKLRVLVDPENLIVDNVENPVSWFPNPDGYEELQPMTTELIRKARELRHRQTRAESLVWSVLRANRLCNKKFRRQHPVHPFVADFACCELSLIVEIDGGYHDYTYEDDTHRQQYLEARGWRVLRFSNEEVIDDVEAVAIAIAKSMGLKPTYAPHVEVRSGMRSHRPTNSPKSR